MISFLFFLTPFLCPLYILVTYTGGKTIASLAPVLHDFCACLQFEAINSKQGCCLRKFFRSPLGSKLQKSGARANFLGAQDKFDMVNGGGGEKKIGKDRGEGGVNCGNIGEGSWVRDFP